MFPQQVLKKKIRGKIHNPKIGVITLKIMKGSDKNLLLDELLTQILQYKSQSEIFHNLFIAEKKDYLLRISQSLDYVFRAFRYLLFKIINEKSDFNNDARNNVDSGLKLLDAIIKKFPELEEKHQFALQNLIKENQETLFKLCQKQFNVAEDLRDVCYYVKLVNILGGDET